MPKTIISDTSCLIALTNIGSLEILHEVYGKVLITSEIVQEFGVSLPNWFEIENPKDLSRLNFLENQLDKGEASAIALALEIPDSLIIVDDEKARKLAEMLNIEITGTLGVIIKAKNLGIINSIKPFLLKLKNVGFRISAELEKEALSLTGE